MSWACGSLMTTGDHWRPLARVLRTRSYASGHYDTSGAPDSPPQDQGKAWMPSMKALGALDRLRIWRKPPKGLPRGPKRSRGPKRPKRSQAVPSGPKRTQAVPSGPKRSQAVPRVPKQTRGPTRSPSGPKRSQAVPSGPKRSQAVPSSAMEC